MVVGKEALSLIVGRDMTADAGLASDSSETDFGLAAVLGSGSGAAPVWLGIYICRSFYAAGEAADGRYPGQ